MFSYKHKTAYDMRSSDWSSCVCFTDLGLPLPDDAVVLASFGDASANHSTAQGAFNAAGWAAFQGSPLPLIFLCEDNGIGISTQLGITSCRERVCQYVYISVISRALKINNN